MGNPVIHFEIQAEDHVALSRFYTELFGWDANQWDPTYSMIETKGDGTKYLSVLPIAKAGVNGGIGNSPKTAPGGVTVYVGTDDVAATLKRAEELGGRTVMEAEVMDEGAGVYGYFADPEGHVIALFSR